MKESYMREAIRQVRETIEKLKSIDSLLVRAFGKDLKWCEHCKLDVWCEDDKCPRCGTSL